MYKRKRIVRRNFRRPRKTFKRTVRRNYSVRRRNVRFRRRGNVNSRTMVTKTFSVDYNLMMESGSTITNNYRQFVRWCPTVPEVITSSRFNLSNDSGGPCIELGTLPAGDAASLKLLYAKTKIKSIIASYKPAQTMGVSNSIPTTGVATFAAQNATMYTIPIYDNIDDIITNGGTLSLGVADIDYQALKVKPYARKHSIYKPWKRVLKPSFTTLIPTWESSNQNLMDKRNSWQDLTQTTSQNCFVNGLLIAMPPIQQAGEWVTGTPPAVHPAANSTFVLGTLTFTYVQMFKIRT